MGTDHRGHAHQEMTKIRYNHAFKIWNLNRDLDGGTEGNAMALNTDGVGPYGLNVVTTRGDHDELTDPDATCSSWVFLRPECGGGGSVRYGDIVQLGNCYTHESVFDGERSVLMTSGLAENGFAAMTTVLSDPQASQPESQWVVRGGPEGRRVHSSDVIKLENVYCHENYYDGANNYLIMRTGTYDDKNCGVEGVQRGHEGACSVATQWQVLKCGEEPDSEESSDDEPCGNPWREWSPKNKIRYNHAFKIWNMNRDLDGGTNDNAMALNTDGVGPYGLNVVTTRGDHDELTDPDATCSSWVFLRPECGGGGSVRYGDIVQLG